MNKVKEGKATYSEAHDYAIETGKILSQSYQDNLNESDLPDGRMYYNIAQRVIEPTMENNYELISQISTQVQENLNKQAKIKIKSQKPALDKSRIQGIVDRVSNEEKFNQIKWILDEPIVNFSQHIVDESIRLNADFQANAGLNAQIVRQANVGACEWCQKLAGHYTYGHEPKDVYRRHSHCRCKTEYDPRDGRRQDVWSKKWNDEEEKSKIEERIEFSKTNLDKTITNENIVLKAINNGEVKAVINQDKQKRHMEDYVSDDRSFVFRGVDCEELLDNLKGTGQPVMSKKGWTKKERVYNDKPVGIYKDSSGSGQESKRIMIIYSKTGCHMYPIKEEND